MNDPFEDRVRARTYAEEHARAFDRAARERRLQERVAADASRGARGVISVVIPFVLRYIPLILVIGFVGTSLNLHPPEGSSTRIHDFVSSWMTSWGLPDVPSVRLFLTWIWTGIIITTYAAIVPAMKLGSAISLDHLQKVGYAAGLVACIVVAIASVVVLVMFAAFATSLMLALFVWLVSMPLQTLRNRAPRSFWNWVLTIMSIWAFRGSLRNAVASRETDLS